jgi:EAL domain-containing protein (putative c-di-GMP-specific phosphodiesterase class I)
LAQGYFFSRPVNVSEIQKYIIWFQFMSTA